MIAHILKAISLVLLVLVPATAAIPVTEVLRPFNVPGSSINTPDAFREQWLRTYSDNQDFGLLNPYQVHNGQVLAIGAVQAHAQRKIQEDKSWGDLVPQGVSAKIAVVGFLTEMTPLSRREDVALRVGIVASMEQLLTIKSDNVRAAQTAERKVIIAATVKIATEFYDTNKSQAYDVNFWKSHFTGQHGVLADNKDVQASLNTRATLAALAIFEITRRGTLADIHAASGMEGKMFINLITEVWGVVKTSSLRAVLEGAHAAASEGKREVDINGDGVPRTPPRSRNASRAEREIATSSTGTPLKVRTGRTTSGGDAPTDTLLSVVVVSSLNLAPSLQSGEELPPLFTGSTPVSNEVLTRFLAPDHVVTYHGDDAPLATTGSSSHSVSITHHQPPQRGAASLPRGGGQGAGGEKDKPKTKKCFCVVL